MCNRQAAPYAPFGACDGRQQLGSSRQSDGFSAGPGNVDIGAVARMIEGKCAMVTGASGSIGSELSRQIAGFKPSKLVVLDFFEFNLYSIDKELDEKFPDIEREFALVDARDGALVAAWIGKVWPDVVFHAAALEHGPLVELEIPCIFPISEA